MYREEFHKASIENRIESAFYERILGFTEKDTEDDIPHRPESKQYLDLIKTTKEKLANTVLFRNGNRIDITDMVDWMNYASIDICMSQIQGIVGVYMWRFEI